MPKFKLLDDIEFNSLTCQIILDPAKSNKVSIEYGSVYKCCWITIISCALNVLIGSGLNENNFYSNVFVITN